MAEVNIIFTLDGVNLTIQSTESDKMKDICQKYSTKIGANVNTFLFLYGGNQLNMDLTFNEQASSIDKNNKEMRILVYKNEKDLFICPKCGEKIELNTQKLDDLISINNKIKDILKGIQFNIENIIRISNVNTINIQLNNINILLNDINEKLKNNDDIIISLLEGTKDTDKSINMNISSLNEIFKSFCNGNSEMESKRFSKLIKECKLLEKKFGINDIDIVFAKVKSGKSKTITFDQFQNAIGEIAKKKGTTREVVENQIISIGSANYSGIPADYELFKQIKEKMNKK